MLVKGAQDNPSNTHLQERTPQNYGPLNAWIFLLTVDQLSSLNVGWGMMTSSNGNVFRLTGPLCGEFTGDRWIPRTKASDAGLWCFLWSAPWTNGWVNNREAGDLRHHRANYDVIIIANGRKLIGHAWHWEHTISSICIHFLWLMCILTPCVKQQYIYWEGRFRNWEVTSFVQAQIKDNIKCDRWIPRTKGQLHRKCFHLMASSWYSLYLWLYMQLILLAFVSSWLCHTSIFIQSFMIDV